MKREKLELIYSVIILLTIPALMVLNTVLLMNNTRKAFNTEVMRKADLVNVAIAESARSAITNDELDHVSTILVNIEKSEASLMGITVARQNSSGTIEQIARSDTAPETPSTGTLTQIRIAYDRKVPIAKLVNVRTDYGNTQAWNVATPILAEDNSVLAVISSNTLTTDADEAINQAYTFSSIILATSVVIVLALLFRHFRLVGYAQLLAKQKEVNQTMSDFLSVATHELKAPTTIMKGYLSNVMDGTFGPIDDKILEQLQVAYAQTDRLNELVQDLLNVSRIEQGRINYNITEVDSAKILQTICTNYKTIATGKGLSLELSATETIPPVTADEGRVQEIFSNLIDNAIKYTANGSVTVSQSYDKSKNIVTTRVRDTGFGMSPDAKKRLFQRFYRIKTDQTKTISGTGLGLWIIKQYIEAMGGTIEVESMEGVGSNFIVTLPAKES